jgi:uncharacterized protein (DUF3084 family)
MLRILLILFCGAAMSGVIAYLGNRLGRHVGRRKMSIFGLRPKYTSNIITVATGSVIFLVTIGLASVASQDVRTFMIGLDELREQQAKLISSIDEKNRKIMIGQIIGPRQALSVGVIECGRPSAEIEEQINTLLSLANRNLVFLNSQAAERYKLPPFSEGTKLVGVLTPERDQLVKDLSEAQGTVVCAVLNREGPRFFGDGVVAEFWFDKNRLVFNKGQVIARRRIDGRMPSDQVYQDVYQFIYGDVRVKALTSGLMKNPISDQLDTSITTPIMKTTADEIARANREKELLVVANADMYTLGPLNVRLEIRAP